VSRKTAVQVEPYHYGGGRTKKIPQDEVRVGGEVDKGGKVGGAIEGRHSTSASMNGKTSEKGRRGYGGVGRSGERHTWQGKEIERV